MRRSRLALGLALAALALALVGAVGPANDVRTTYTWPPPNLPGARPATAWYTPLLLVRRQPETISARIPCSLPPALPEATGPLTVLATTRFPERSSGLALTSAGGTLEAAVGREVFARVPLTAGTGSSCEHRLELRAGAWSLETASDRRSEGELEALPVVDGLFSELDLASGTPPSIAVTTAIHATRPTAVQKLAWVLAAVAIVAALLLVSFERRPRRPSRAAISAIATAARPVDLVVGVVLVAWWIVGPAFIDDGWVVARQRTFAESGGFSNYFDTLGLNVPLSYWLEWAQHWLTESSNTLLVLRLPALVCLAAVWVLCRWVLRQAVGASEMGGPTLWGLAAAFLVGALAWGMTLRPEPTTALVAIGVLACTVRFLERSAAGPLAAAAVLVPLAVMGHHAGVVALAPLIAAAPAVFAWARPRLAFAGTIVSASLASFAVLAFVGADLGQRRADAEGFRSFTSSEATWRDEVLRYVRLSEFPHATPLRRLSVVLIALAVLAFLLRRQRERRALLDLPAAALGVGLVLLIATPSKWPWHFGALAGIAAVAVACETARLREDAARSSGWQARPFVALGAVLLAAAWIWSPRTAWNRIDLLVLDWIPAFESRLGLSKIAFAVPLLVLAGFYLAALVRGSGSAGMRQAPWSTAAWAAPLLAVPALAFTIGVLVADTAKADAWTLTRQNLASLRGDSGCGLADDLLVVDPASTRPLSALRPIDRAPPAWAPPAPSNDLAVFAPEVGAPTWFALEGDARVGIYLAGTPGSTDVVELTWGRRRGNRVRALEAGEVPLHLSSEPESGIVAWSFLPASVLPPRPAGANAVGVSLRADRAGEIAVTAPLRYENVPLASRLGQATSALAVPELATYFPCVRQPLLRDGVVESPQLIVTPYESTSWLRTWETSPFEGVLDLYPVARVSVADTEDPPPEVAVLEVDPRIPGAQSIAPEKAAQASTETIASTTRSPARPSTSPTTSATTARRSAASSPGFASARSIPATTSSKLSAA